MRIGKRFDWKLAWLGTRLTSFSSFLFFFFCIFLPIQKYSCVHNIRKCLWINLYDWFQSLYTGEQNFSRNYSHNNFNHWEEEFRVMYIFFIFNKNIVHLCEKSYIGFPFSCSIYSVSSLSFSASWSVSEMKYKRYRTQVYRTTYCFHVCIANEILNINVRLFHVNNINNQIERNIPKFEITLKFRSKVHRNFKRNLEDINFRSLKAL